MVVADAMASFTVRAAVKDVGGVIATASVQVKLLAVICHAVTNSHLHADFI